LATLTVRAAINPKRHSLFNRRMDVSGKVLTVRLPRFAIVF